ncbi:hypothetical protein GQR58_023916 [Nymphon striatum]|nr:hypothetical protein GQR58_023916 [Nymphon striatum]
MNETDLIEGIELKVYEVIPETGFLVSQSADSSCNGFVQTGDGSRIMTLTAALFKHEGEQETMIVRATCIREMNSTNQNYKVLVHSITECDSGYYCLYLDKKNVHVVDIITERSEIHPEYERCNGPNKEKKSKSLVEEIGFIYLNYLKASKPKKYDPHEKPRYYYEAQLKYELMSLACEISILTENGEEADKVSSSDKLSSSASTEKASSTWQRCREPFGGNSELSISQVSISAEDLLEPLPTCNQYSILKVACDQKENTLVLMSECPSISMPNKVQQQSLRSSEVQESVNCGRTWSAKFGQKQATDDDDDVSIDSQRTVSLFQ